MTFDPMAAAVDWLDAYRAGDIENLLTLYAEDVVFTCGCSGGERTIDGGTALRAYWMDRLQRNPASDLMDLRAQADGIEIEYAVPHDHVRALMKFNPRGRIAQFHCRPSSLSDDGPIEKAG